MRERSRRASPQPDYSYLYLLVDVGSDLLIDNKESSAPGARLSWLYVSCDSTHRAAALVLGSDALLKKNAT